MRGSRRPGTRIIEAPSYQRLDEGLREADTGLRAAELHGSLCAQLTAATEMPGGRWVDVAAGGDVPRTLLGGPTAALLDDLFAWTVQHLEALDFRFELFLPADDAPLAARTEALALWCAGYLAGLGQALGREFAPAPRAEPAASEPAGPVDTAGLPDEAGEFVRDLAELARADFGVDNASEADEQAYAELVEYARVGAMVVYETLRGPEGGTALH